MRCGDAIKAFTVFVTFLSICLFCSSSKAVSKPKVIDSGNANYAATCLDSDTNGNDGTIENVPRNKPWLIISIPTVPRVRTRDHEQNLIDYLTPTLNSLISNLPVSIADPLWGKVKVVVFNNRPKEDHVVYYQNRDRLKDDIHFDFVENSWPVTDPLPGRMDTGTRNRPGYKVRQQTRDVVSAMRYIDSVYEYEYFLFMEDDFELCVNGFDAIRYLLNRARLYHGDWIAVRASFGLNGVFLFQRDVSVLANYLEKHQARRPPDHLVVEWYAGETKESSAYKGSRVNVGFRFNIFNHIGVVSSLRVKKQKTNAYPRCWEELTVPAVFPVEAWNSHDCPQDDDDIWPCIWSAKSACERINENCAAVNIKNSLPKRIRFERQGTVWS